MRHRIFIAINLPEEIKKQLVFLQSKWSELPIRWTEKENLHITLVFLGYVRDEELMTISEIVKEAALKTQPFLIALKRICYGPSSHNKSGSDLSTKKLPRMIWVEGEKSRELGKLKGDLETGLERKISGFEKENRAYSPHLTLGRIKQWEFKTIDPEERPVVDEEISLSCEVNSIEIMESKLKPKGPDYFVLESILLGSK